MLTTRYQTGKMKFSVGDKVLLKRTGEEGVVTAQLAHDMFEVEAGGTTFPVHLDDMEHPYLRWFLEKRREKGRTRQTFPEQLPVEKPQFPASRLSAGVYLSFLPVYRPGEMEDLVDLLKIFLANELNVPVRYRYEVRIAGSSFFAHEGSLQPFSHVYLHNIPYEMMNDQPRFHWELAGVSDPPMRGREGVLRIRPPQLFARIMQLQQQNEPMFSYLLTETVEPPPQENRVWDTPPPQRPKTVGGSAGIRRGSPRPTMVLQDMPRYELDLHIEQLVSNVRGLSNSDMLEIQLTHLRHYLRLAIAHRFERMIVIHGLGRGVLREAVHDMLRETSEVARFTNEWHGRYGFGATEVFFSY